MKTEKGAGKKETVPTAEGTGKCKCETGVGGGEHSGQERPETVGQAGGRRVSWPGGSTSTSLKTMQPKLSNAQ